jgi:hypothetical protein
MNTQLPATQGISTPSPLQDPLGPLSARLGALPLLGTYRNFLILSAILFIIAFWGLIMSRPAETHLFKMPGATGG